MSGHAYVPEQRWQTMESAPTDRAILLYGTMRPFDEIKSEGPLVFTGYWDSMDEQWCTTGSTWTGPFFDPTHWRPIPDPPTHAPKGEGE